MMRVMRYVCIMRTTIAVDDHLLAAAKRRAREYDQSPGVETGFWVIHDLSEGEQSG
jgi:hypothetical protein